jgi:hypothetical protein
MKSRIVEELHRLASGKDASTGCRGKETLRVSNSIFVGDPDIGQGDTGYRCFTTPTSAQRLVFDLRGISYTFKGKESTS